MKPMFVIRDPWAAVIVALVLGPFGGMLYLGKGRLAVGYLFLEILVYAVGVALIGVAGPLLLRIAGCVHCYFIAKRLNGQRPEAWFARWYSILLLLFIIPGVSAYSVRVALWEPFHVPAADMTPTLVVGDYILVSKFSYGYSRHSFPIDLPFLSGRILGSEPERGDIVVAALPEPQGYDMLKRIVGLPGDRIQILQGILHINGEPVERRSVGPYEARIHEEIPDIYTRYIERLPNGREYSILEASDHGRLDNTDVYRVPSGNYFVLGDNRDQSLDSRVLSHFGFIPYENLIGRVSVVFWNEAAPGIRFPD